MNSPTVVMAQISTKVCITHANGLHARPSVMFTQLAKSFVSIISIADKAQGPWLNAKSIVKVMGLKAPFGAILFIRALGSDAELALKSLSQLVENDFDGDCVMNGGENANPA